MVLSETTAEAYIYISFGIDGDKEQSEELRLCNLRSGK